ncbi:MAG TPA: hypothetical protein VLY87_00735 [Flavobacterium sp.]|nr:hypothetical protein [Flavobacterium sp.]
MKKAILSIVVFLFSVLMYAQEYPFVFTKSGERNQVLIFIPGFASSGDVWDETVDVLNNDYTCYKLTFAGVEPQEKASFEY